MGSAGMAISCYGFRRADPAVRQFIPGLRVLVLCRPLLAVAELTQQSLQAEQLLPARIGNRAIPEIARSPECQVIAVPGRVLGQEVRIGGPAVDVDEVWAVLVDDHGSALASHGINASADQPIALWRKIRHRRRDIG